MEFGSGVLQDAVQPVPLGKDRQHRSLDIAHEETYRVPAPYQGLALAEAAADGDDENRLVQATCDKAGSLDFAASEQQNVSLMRIDFVRTPLILIRQSSTVQ